MVNPEGTSDLFYFTLGEGPPLLLMHGGMGFDHTVFRPFLDPLAEHFTLVFYDHRGNGRSPVPLDWEQVSIGSWAADAEALRSDLGFDQWYVLGHSFGAMVALKYAISFPDAVSGLIISSAAPYNWISESALAEAQARSTPDRFAAITKIFSEPIADDEAYRAAADLVAPLYFARMTDEIQAMLAGISFRADAFNRSMELLAQFDLGKSLPELCMPVLAISGVHDWICSPPYGIAPYLQAAPNASGVEFLNSGHFPHAEEPELFRDTLTAWYHLQVRSSNSYGSVA